MSDADNVLAVIAATACPVCGAAPGSLCLASPTADGKPMAAVHIERRTGAYEATEQATTSAAADARRAYGAVKEQLDIARTDAIKATDARDAARRAHSAIKERLDSYRDELRQARTELEQCRDQAQSLRTQLIMTRQSRDNYKDRLFALQQHADTDSAPNEPGPDDQADPRATATSLLAQARSAVPGSRARLDQLAEAEVWALLALSGPDDRRETAARAELEQLRSQEQSARLVAASAHRQLAERNREVAELKDSVGAMGRQIASADAEAASLRRGLLSDVGEGINQMIGERRRQLQVLGYDAEHDREHTPAELCQAAAAYLGWAPWPWPDGFDPTNKLSVLVDVETVHDDPVPGRSTVYERARIPRDKVSAFDMVRAGALAAAAYDRTPRQAHDGQD